MSLKAKVIQGAFWTAGSLLGTQLLNFLATLILAKLLVPSDFGIVAIAQLIVTIAQIVRDLGLAQALIYRAGDIEEAASTAFFLVLIWGVLLCLLIGATASQTAFFFNEPRATAVIRVLAFTLVISSFGVVPSALLEKALEFKKKVLPEFFPVVVYAFIAIGLAALGLGIWSIVWGRIGQAALSAILMWKASHWRLKFSFEARIAREILGYGKHILGGSILNMVFLYIDNAFVGKILGATALGYYTFAFAMANLPTQSVTPVVNKVAFPSYVQLRDRKLDLGHAYLRSLKLVSLITFPATLGLAAISPKFLHTLYGHKWDPSIVLIQILSFYALARSIGALPGNIFLSIGKQYLIPRLMLIYVGTVGLLLGPATHRLGTPGTSLVMTGVMVIGSTVWLALSARYLDIAPRRFLANLGPQIAASATMVGGLSVLTPRLPDSPVALAILIGGGAGLYVVGVWVFTRGGIYEEVIAMVRTLFHMPGVPDS